MQYSDFEQKLQPCKGKNILLGFSGGADSCALFLLLAHWSKIIPFKLTAVHFEHGLRGAESLDDAEFCKNKAAEYGIDFLLFHLYVKDNMQKNETVESAARRMRLQQWSRIAADFENCEIHLAHHQDDLTENILLRLFRGANMSGLDGLRETTVINGLRFRRIMLDHSKAELLGFLEDEKFGTFCIDKTNADCTIGRNFIRNKLLDGISKVFPYAPHGIAQSAKVCAIDADFIEQCAAEEFKNIRDCEIINDTFWRKLHPALLVRVMRLYISRKLAADFIPGKNFIERFSETLQKESNHTKLELNDEFFYVRRNGMWQIENKNMPAPEKMIWDVFTEKTVIFGNIRYTAEIVEKMDLQFDRFFFDMDVLKFPLSISRRISGERFEKFGGSHTTVKAELTNRKICGAERDNIGILRDGDEKILLLGDFRRSSFAPICNKKQKILQITVEKLKN